MVRGPRAKRAASITFLFCSMCDLRHRLHLIPETWVTLFWNNGIAEVDYAMERECYRG